MQQQSTFQSPFIIDVSAHVNNAAEDYTPNQLGVNYKYAFANKTELAQFYTTQEFIVESENSRFVLRYAVLVFLRAALIFGPAVAQAVAAAEAAEAVEAAQNRAGGDLTLVFHSDAAATVEQHYFVANELRRAGLRWSALQMNFNHDTARHEAIAQVLGPYNIS